MNVYVWTNTMKNAYIGEYGWKYTYDFRNKTVQNLTDDWWTYVSSATVNANWITFSSWNAIFNQPSWLQAKMANAERLVLVYTMSYNGWYGSTAGLTLSANSGQNTWETWLFLDHLYYAASINNSSLVQNSHWSLSWDFTNTVDYDFVNKKCSVSFPWIYTNTFSITDSQISGTRNLAYIRCPVSLSYIKTISVEVS